MGFTIDSKTDSSASFTISLSNPFNTSYYKEVTVGTGTTTEGSSTRPTGVVWSKTAPSSNSSSNVTGTESGLSSNTSYSWNAYAQAANGNYYSAGSATFTTLLSTPSWYYSNTIKGCTSIYLDWSSVSGATSYDFFYKNSGSSLWNTVNTTSTDQTVSGLSQGTTYNFAVRALSSSNNSDTTYADATTLDTPSIPSAPSLSSRGEGALTVNISSTTGASSYKLRYWNYNNTYNYQNASTSGDHTIVSLEYGVAYYVDVQAINSCGSSSYSNDLYTITNPKKPTITLGAGSNYVEATISGMEGNWDHVKVFLYKGATHIETKQVTTNDSVVRFETGIETGTQYTVYATSYYIWSHDNNTYSSTQASESITTSTLTEWKWTTANDANGLKVQGANFKMGDQEWNDFCTSINQHRSAKGLANYTFTVANLGYEFTHTQMNEAIYAIWESGMGVTRTQPTIKAKSDKLTAWDFNQMKYALDDVRLSI